MARESGFEIEVDDEVRANLEELKALADCVGTTGLLALKPFLHMSRKNLWQLYMLAN